MKYVHCNDNWGKTSVNGRMKKSSWDFCRLRGKHKHVADTGIDNMLEVQRVSYSFVHGQRGVNIPISRTERGCWEAHQLSTAPWRAEQTALFHKLLKMNQALSWLKNPGFAFTNCYIYELQCNIILLHYYVMIYIRIMCHNYVYNMCILVTYVANFSTVSSEKVLSKLPIKIKAYFAITGSLYCT